MEQARDKSQQMAWETTRKSAQFFITLGECIGAFGQMMEAVRAQRLAMEEVRNGQQAAKEADQPRLSGPAPDSQPAN